MAQQRITVDTVSTAIFNLAIGGNHAGAVSRFSDLNSLLALVAAHPSNVTFLSLKLDVTQLPYVLHLLYNALNAPADNLEHLAIQVANSSEVNPPPIQLLRGRFPSLRFLSLDGLHIHHSSDVVPRLRVLKLWNHPAPPSALHPDELMAILRDAKSLKTLDIHRFLSVFAFQDDGPIRAPLQLPLLESFTCTDDIHSIRLFLQEVDIGPNVRTEFTAILPSDYAADLLTMYGPVSSVITLPGEWIEARARALAKLNPGEVPVDYPPVGWVFPSDRNLPTLLNTVTHIALSRNSSGDMELVGTSNTGGKLICRIPPGNPFLNRYHLMSSALCTICADLVIQRDVRLQTLEIAAELDFINPVNWYQLFHATPHLTTLRLHDTARGRFGEASHGAHDVFRALSLDPDVRARHAAELRSQPSIIKRLARSSPCGNLGLAAPRLQMVTLRGPMCSQSLLATIHAALASRVEHAPGEIGVVKSLVLDLRAADPASAAQMEASNEYRALVQWARRVGTNLSVNITHTVPGLIPTTPTSIPLQSIMYF